MRNTSRGLLIASGVCAISMCLVACGGASVKLNTEPVPNDTLTNSSTESVAECCPVVNEQAQKKLREREEKLQELLFRARQALDKDNLKKPETDNAFDWYKAVLAIDGDNKEAHWGMGQITARYLVLAIEAFKSNSADKAETMLERALTVSATPEQVASLRKQFKKREQQLPANEFRLSVTDLSARNAKSVALLDKVARMAKEYGSRLLIIARNDAEGRWMYQKMRSAVVGHRLRGNIKLGKKPAIVLIDMEA